MSAAPSGAGEGPPPARAAAPVDVRRALVLFVASGIALVGVLVLVGCWIVVGARAGETTQEGSACLAAVDAQEPGAKIAFELMPPRSTCTFYQSDDLLVTEVLADVPPALAWAALAAALGGGLTCIAMFVVPRLRR
ncbi:hypothetical protein CCO02nite_22050 [Cellulomonas composti]|uniref:Uncharacterized protein n=1 Tax=Cellulomonas composti TaxID=266130 RepID=A0A511JC26_9CELL|nr:hypothetical protein CCO02nite_22050 [Cellulomonas composti]